MKQAHGAAVVRTVAASWGYTVRKRISPLLAFFLVLSAVHLVGCPVTKVVSGHYVIEVGSQVRSFRLFVPSSYTPDAPIPLVIALHGLKMDDDILAAYTGLEQTAEREGFVVVFPNGRLTMWRAVPKGQPFTDFELVEFLFEGIDDVAFMSELIDELANALTIDETRIYVCGLSNGGMMSYLTALELSDRIAAAAAVASPMPKNYTLEPAPTKTVPFLIMHGTDDPVLPYDGGDVQLSLLLDLAFSTGVLNFSMVDFLPIDDVAAQWARWNGAAVTPIVENLPDTDTNDGTTIVRRTYTGGAEGSDVVLYAIEGGGHTWPGAALSVPILAAGNTCYDVTANDVLWDFFRRFQRK